MKEEGEGSLPPSLVLWFGKAIAIDCKIASDAYRLHRVGVGVAVRVGVAVGRIVLRVSVGDADRIAVGLVFGCGCHSPAWRWSNLRSYLRGQSLNITSIRPSMDRALVRQ